MAISRFLEVVPDLLDRIEFGRIERQELDLHIALLRFEPAAHQRTAMGAEPVPDDQLEVTAKRRALSATQQTNPCCAWNGLP